MDKLHMTFCQKLSYSVGHVLNDLTASMWFTYMIIYFHEVKNFDNGLSGNLVLIGQISDAIFTPFIGYESDRVSGFFNMGKRKTWHFIGTICVTCSFPFLFVDCITCSNAPDWSQFIYYIPFVVIFQFGWASVQINHLSLIPDLTADESERVGLNGMRSAFTVLSNMVVYGIAWLIFVFETPDKPNSSSSQSSSTQLQASDAPKFRLLVLVVVGLGLIFSIIFHLGVKEKKKECHEEGQKGESGALDTIEVSTVKKLNMSWKCWLKEHQFYQVAVIYMSTRLVVNVSQVYLPMFIVETIKLDKESIAIIPLVVYVSGFITSLMMRRINNKIGRKWTFCIGIMFSIGACVMVHFLPVKSKAVYGVAVLIGIGGSTMLVTSLTMTADLISCNTESSAFVYGAMSFTDKLSNGIAVLLIQQFHPCLTCCPKCVEYYRNILTFVPGSFAVLALILLITMIPQTLGTRRKQGEILKPVLNGTSHSQILTDESYQSIEEPCERDNLLPAGRLKVNGQSEKSKITAGMGSYS